jgi:hypothetical protein
MFIIELSLFLVQLLNDTYCVYTDRGSQMRKKNTMVEHKKKN